VGPDKRRVHSKEELRRIFQDSGLLQADAVPVPDIDSKAVDLRVLAKVMTQLDEPAPRSAKAAWGQLERIGLARAGHLTFAGLLLFAKRPQHFRPQFSLGRGFTGSCNSFPRCNSSTIPPRCSFAPSCSVPPG
jgi:ATP-dependent DNA helicase RecG